MRKKTEEYRFSRRIDGVMEGSIPEILYEHAQFWLDSFGAVAYIMSMFTISEGTACE